MYNKDEFYIKEYKDIALQFQDSYVKFFDFENKAEAEKKDLFKHVMENIKNNKIHNIFQVINAFFMFKDQYDIIEHRYLKRSKEGHLIETPEEMCDRVAMFIAIAEPHDNTSNDEEKKTGMDRLNKWYPIFLEHLLDFRICPSTPTWSCAGIPGCGCFACSVVENGDSLPEISKWYHDTIFLNRYSFGIGHSLHKVRPKGAPFGNSKSSTKSSIKWLSVIQELSVSMAQGNSGRGGANMVTMPIWHPDVIEFIDYKIYPEDQKTPVREIMKHVMNCDLSVGAKEALIEILDKSIPLKNFNMSVVINDKFMRAVEDDDMWEMKFELPDHSWKKVIKEKATKIWKKICDGAVESGDPGILFFDRVNQDNFIKKSHGDIYCTNPCGEIPLHAGSLCNLWTINLSKHINYLHRKVSWGKLRDSINISVRMADNLVTVNEYPKEVPIFESEEKSQRRIGIDYTGVADALFVMKQKYGSKESYTTIEELYKFMRDTSVAYSVKLGKSKGSFPLLRDSELRWSETCSEVKRCPKCDSKVEIHDDYWQCSKCVYGNYKYLRNVALMTQAPTGTRSRMLGVSFGIEPHFAKWWKSNVMEGKVVYNVSHQLDWQLRNFAEKYNVPVSQIYNVLDGTIDNESTIYLDSLRKLMEPWIETYDVTPTQHIKMQATAQRWIEQAVSKTINAPKGTTSEDVSAMYFDAWKSGCKGITVYIDGSHFKQVIGADIKCPECKSKNLLAIEGCCICKDCEWSACSVG